MDERERESVTERERESVCDRERDSEREGDRLHHAWSPAACHPHHVSRLPDLWTAPLKRVRPAPALGPVSPQIDVCLIHSEFTHSAVGIPCEAVVLHDLSDSSCSDKSERERERMERR